MKRSLRRILDGPAGAIVVWLLILILTVVYGTFGQWVIFGRGETNWQFLERWPILWLAYFFFGHVTGEFVTRWLAEKLNL